MNIEITKHFRTMLVNSLDTAQINYLGESIDRRFDVHRETGIASHMPIQRKTAANILLKYFNEDQDIVDLFTIMLRNEGRRFYNATLNIWRKEEFINLLRKYKWIYDPDLVRFLLDPFYAHEINLLKDIQIIDLRSEVDLDSIIPRIKAVSTKLSIQDLEWRVTMRLYDIESRIGELIRTIIGLLLARQDLQMYAFELYTCLKELVVNATKANYKLLFDKHVTRPQGISADKNYVQFLQRFREEIEENGNSKLIELAKERDRYISIVFQSTADDIEIWVTNSAHISVIEKQQIVKKLGGKGFGDKDSFKTDGDYAEGAGLGLNLILSILRKYTAEKDPLKFVFYPDSIKIGFMLKRSDLLDKKPKEPDKQ